jgi:hypothetical protein
LIVLIGGSGLAPRDRSRAVTELEPESVIVKDLEDEKNSSLVATFAPRTSDARFHALTLTTTTCTEHPLPRARKMAFLDRVDRAP